MLPYMVHALLPYLTARINGTHLPSENLVETLRLIFGPFDTGGHHQRRKAGLEDTDGVFDDGEVHKGELKDVQWEIAFEDELSGR